MSIPCTSLGERPGAGSAGSAGPSGARRCGWRRVCLAGHALVALWLLCGHDVRAQMAGAETQHDESWDEEEDNGASSGRWFLYGDLVFSGFYSPEGVAGLPSDDKVRKHFQVSPRPPGNYVGVDFVQTFGSDDFVNDTVLPDWLPMEAIDLHPRLVFDRMENRQGFHRMKFAPQDFWIRFNPGGVDRLSLRVGQFVIPYGVNPLFAPRQRFILPVEATDLGLKWDWGLDLKGPLGEYDWEAAATIGSGEALHSAEGEGRASYLFTGRVGTPTYWDVQYGLSGLVGDLPVIRAVKVLSPVSISRWRVGLDGMYKYGTYLMGGAQLTYGQDGYAGDAEYVGITGGRVADVLGYRVWADWVVPAHQDLRLGAQFESVVRDLPTADSDDTAAIFEIGYSIFTSISAMVDYRLEVNGSMGEVHDAVFLTLVYYGLL